MKKIISAIILAILLLTCAFAEEARFDLSQYSFEELREIRTLLDGYLSPVDKGEILYQEDGIIVSWRGIVQDGGNYKADLFITNNTGARMKFGLDSLYINGFDVGMLNAYTASFDSGITISTASVNAWLVEIEDLEACGVMSIKDITSVDIVMKVYNENKEVLREIPLSNIGVKQKDASESPEEEPGRLIYQDDEISVVWKGMVQGGGYCKPNMLVTNNSDRVIAVDLDPIIINDFKVGMNNPNKEEIEPGVTLATSTYNSWRIGFDNLSVCGIETLEEIEWVDINLEIYHDDYQPVRTVFLTDIAVTHDLPVYEGPEREPGELVYQEDGISIVWNGVVRDDDYYKLDMFVTNNTEDLILMEISDLIVNDSEMKMTNTGEEYVEPGATAVTAGDIHWRTKADQMAAAGVKDPGDISSLRFTLEICDGEQELIRSIRLSGDADQLTAETLFAAPTPTPKPTPSPEPTPTPTPVPVETEAVALEPGMHFTYGQYKQGLSGEKAPIEWRVLAVEDQTALVISEKALDVYAYSEAVSVNTYAQEGLCWENCDLNEWMNSDFLKAAFPEAEAAAILETENVTEDACGTCITTDKLFCLSIEEVRKYFADGEPMAARPTQYAYSRLKKDAGATDSNGYCIWWLRDLAEAYKGGAVYNEAAVVSQTYGLKNPAKYAMPVLCADLACVRPAMWLDLTRIPKGALVMAEGVQYEQLQSGSKGEAVEALQNRLNELGYSVGKADGDYGNKTKTAIEAFQRMNNLPVTGIADTDTQAAIYSSAAVKPTATPKPTSTPKPSKKSSSSSSSSASLLSPSLCKEIGLAYLYGRCPGAQVVLSDVATDDRYCVVAVQYLYRGSTKISGIMIDRTNGKVVDFK